MVASQAAYAAIARRADSKSRYMVRPTVSSIPTFHWVDAGTLPDASVVVVARDDDFTYGLFNSRLHQVWTDHMGSTNRYSIRKAFETFPLPDVTPRETTIPQAARALAEVRETITEQLRNSELTWRDVDENPPATLRDAQELLDRMVCDAYEISASATESEIMKALVNHKQTLDLG